MPIFIFTIISVYNELGYHEVSFMANNCNRSFSTLYTYYELRLLRIYLQYTVEFVITGVYCIANIL